MCFDLWHLMYSKDMLISSTMFHCWQTNMSIDVYMYNNVQYILFLLKFQDKQQFTLMGLVTIWPVYGRVSYLLNRPEDWVRFINLRLIKTIYRWKP